MKRIQARYRPTSTRPGMIAPANSCPTEIGSGDRLPSSSCACWLAPCRMSPTKISTVDGVSSLQVSSAGKFNSGDAAAATPDVTIKLEGNNLSGQSVNSLVVGLDPTIKIDHNNS